jgi:hypothetical protein
MNGRQITFSMNSKVKTNVQKVLNRPEDHSGSALGNNIAMTVAGIAGFIMDVRFATVTSMMKLNQVWASPQLS